jgi:hypothetical protein
MPKSKEKKKPILPKAEELAGAKSLLEKVQRRTAHVAKAKAAATKEGKFDKYDPKYRAGLKGLKRAQRALHAELLRHQIKEAPAAAAPAEAAPAAEAKTG